MDMIEYNGKEYEDHKAVYRDFDNERHERVKESTFLARVRNGKSIKEALETPTDSRGRKKKEEKPDTVSKERNTTKFQLLEQLKRSQEKGKFKSSNKEQEATQSESKPSFNINKEKTVDTLSNPLQKRVTLYFARVLIDQEERAVIGFTTEKHPHDLEIIEADTLLLSKVDFSTAGQIQKDITEYFSARIDNKETRQLTSSQCFNFDEDEFYEALDYIYLLIATYQ